MPAISDSLLAALRAEALFVYEPSLNESEGLACAIVRDGEQKRLAVMGERVDDFAGEARGAFRLCPLTVDNAAALQEHFPYTRPKSHAGHKFTMGLGDRLGLATPGHVRAIADYDVYPVLAQQSIRELTLTKRSFSEVIAAASFGVLQEGYQGGFGADGDHLKSEREIAEALASGCTMITLDCSEHISYQAANYSEAEVADAYAALPQELRARLEADYLRRELPVIGTIKPSAFRRIVLVFWKAIEHAARCYHYIEEIKSADVDFELSIDETRTITTPQEHYVIASELLSRGVRPVSVAPHFSGAFEKGIEYSGNLTHFARDFEAHQQIAALFGYKLSLHSGSDKFSVFPTVGRVTKGHVHVKTAGTNWLEAMRVVSRHAPALYRRAHSFALQNRAQAEAYYHVSTRPEDIPDIELESDVYLPEYLELAASRQTMHIAYGLLLNEDWFREAFFRFMATHEEAYYAGLITHIDRHLRYLAVEKRAIAGGKPL